MDIYTLGSLALPVVVSIMAVSAVLTFIMGIFTAVKTYTNVQRFLQKMDQSRQPAVTININSGKGSSEPPMRERK